MKKLQTLLTLLLLAALSMVQANALQPDELIKQTSEKVLKILQDNKAEYEKNPEKVSHLVDTIIIPLVDFRAMSKLALGKNWRSANEDQQLRFTEAFKTMLIRTYSKSLIEYTDQKIEFLPYDGPEEGKRTTEVKTQVMQASGPAIPIDYRLREKDGEWKVYDIKIDGISLVTNYRNSFAADIRKVGMDGLIDKLLNKTDASS